MPLNRKIPYFRICWLCFVSASFALGVAPARSQLLGPGQPNSNLPALVTPDAFVYAGQQPGYIMVIEKSTQTALLYRHDGQHFYLEKIMPCSTGENQGDKLVEGDKKTPEGFYIFTRKMVKTELSDLYGVLAYPMDYPNFWDKNLGRSGYGIWTHGITKPLKNYDSNGCVELHNLDIIELESLITLYDTPILVYETVKYRPVQEAAAEAARLKAVIEEWRRAWADKDLKLYQARYDRKFINSDGRTFEAWMKHKEHLARTYKNIKVEVKNLRIYRHREVIVALFEQHYQGDGRFKSAGIKRLYLGDQSSGYRILAEEFTAFPPSQPSKWLTAAEKEAALLAAEAPAGGPLAVAQASYNPNRGPRPAAPETTFAPAAPAAAASEASGSSGALEKPALLASAGAALNFDQIKPLPWGANGPPREAVAAPAAEKTNASPPPPESKTALSAGPESNPEKIVGDLVLNWATAWRRKDKSAYFACYDQDFIFKDRNLKLPAFKVYRSRLMDGTKNIELKVEQLRVTIGQDTAKAVFIQTYQADNYKDRGRKVMLLKKRSTGWKIVEESWTALRS